MLYFRWLVFLGLTILAVIGILPNIEYYSNYFNRDLKSESEISYSNELKDKSLTLGLDLQGGIHMVLELDLVDFYKNLVDERIKNDFGIISRFSNQLIKIHNQSTSNNFIDNLFAQVDNKFLIRYYSDLIPDNLKEEKAIEFLKIELKNKLITELPSVTEIIRKRVDAMGLIEPDIYTRGNNQIIVEIPGMSDEKRAKELIQKTGKLEFFIVNNDQSILDELSDSIDVRINKGIKLKDKILVTQNGPIGGNLKIATKMKNQIDSILSSQSVKTLLSDYDYQFLWGKEEFGDTQKLYFLNKKVELSGNEMKDPSAEQYNFEHQNSGDWYISFNLLNPGKFEELTTNNIGKQLAIVLDGTIESAPQINGPISGGKGMISGDFTAKEAKDLETILKAGELPAKINIISQNQVEASLGASSIKSSFKTMIFAFIMILGFMFFYYKGFGLLANLAVILNLLFIIAFLSNPWINATLTLSGIAGIILTIGMAIDANVIIFERIKEEIINGKRPFDAIEFGYQKAFRTILDSNLTTLISAGSLYLFASGSIKGFAITLSIGIICSMFTAIFITKTIVLTFFKIKNVSKLSI